MRKTTLSKCSKMGMALMLCCLPTMAGATSVVAAPAASAATCVAAATLDAEVSSEETVYYFLVWLRDGSKMTFPFAEQPTLTYEETHLLLTTTKDQIEIQHDEVDRFTLAKTGDSEVTAIDKIVAEAKMQRQGNQIYLSDCRANTQVQVYDQSGRMVIARPVDEEGKCQISLEGKATGVYIVRTENITFKILKK